MSYFSFPLLRGIRAVTPCRFVHAFCFYNAYKNLVSYTQIPIHPVDVLSNRDDEPANTKVDSILTGLARIFDEDGQTAIIANSRKAMRLSIYVDMECFHIEAR